MLSYIGYKNVCFQTAVLLVCILTLLTEPFLDGVGELPLNPGFWIPKPACSVPAFCCVVGRGFFKLDLSGLLVTEDPTVDPFEDSVVDNVAILPLELPRTYGLPLASVIDTVPRNIMFIS